MSGLPYFLFSFPISSQSESIDRQGAERDSHTIKSGLQPRNMRRDQRFCWSAGQWQTTCVCALFLLLFQGNWRLYWTSQGQKLWHTGAFWEKRAQCCRHCCSHGCDKGNADSELVLSSPRGTAEGWCGYECSSLFFSFKIKLCSCF